jgi:phosphatidylserine/phosphatidylglycerophosphate/cardiolipin synthase-like enzyme
METYSKNSKISLGRGKGIEILKAIKNAKSSVKIVSPYLSPDYIKELIKLHNKNVQITLISCDNLETNNWSDFKHSDIINRTKIEDKALKKLKKKLVRISLIFLIISIIIFFLSTILPILLYLSVFLIGIMLLIFAFAYMLEDCNYEYYPIFRLKVFDSKSGINPQSTNLIHSKIFLIDEKILFLGSANFTYSAFNTHYETIIQIQDTQAIVDISNEIENLFNSKELKEKSFEELFRE